MYRESQKLTQAAATPPLWAQCVCKSRSDINSTGEPAELLKLKGTPCSLDTEALLHGRVIWWSQRKAGEMPSLLLLPHIALSTSCQTCNQLLKSWERRNAAVLFY